MRDDELPLLVSVQPLTRGRNATHAEAWGVRITGPERIERLAHGERRRGMRDLFGHRWRGLVWEGEVDLLHDLEALGWTLDERRPRGNHVTLILAKPGTGTESGQQRGGNRNGPLTRLVKRLLL
jgi:hypothetical protein